MSLVIKTDDGSVTLRHELLGELYHSDRGAVSEALHVYINAALVDYIGNHPHTESIKIFEVGFGTGLNALLTANLAQDYPYINFEYHGIELYPLSSDVYMSLNYPDPQNILTKMHLAPWDNKIPEAITSNFKLSKYHSSLLDFDTSSLQGFSVVYFDAFAPDTQPELWSDSVFRKFYGILSSGGIITTYSAKGIVKQALRNSGFIVQRLVGALGKRHMLRAIKPY